MSLIPAAPASRATLDYHADVRYFGAIGNGLVDDTEAFVSAIAAAKLGGGIVIVPPGIYATNIVLDEECANIMFAGTGMDVEASQSNCLVPWDITKPVIDIVASGVGEWVKGVTISNLGLYGVGPNGRGSVGLRIASGTYFLHVLSVGICGFSTDNLMLTADFAPVSHVYFTGMRVKSASGTTADALHCEYNSGSDTAGYVTAVGFVNCSFVGPTSGGYALHISGTNPHFANTWVQATGDHAVLLGRVTLDGHNYDGKLRGVDLTIETQEVSAVTVKNSYSTAGPEGSIQGQVWVNSGVFENSAGTQFVVADRYLSESYASINNLSANGLYLADADALDRFDGPYLRNLNGDIQLLHNVSPGGMFLFAGYNSATFRVSSTNNVAQLSLKDSSDRESTIKAQDGYFILTPSPSATDRKMILSGVGANFVASAASGSPGFKMAVSGSGGCSILQSGTAMCFTPPASGDWIFYAPGGSTKLVQGNGTGLGFFAATPAAKPTVSGARNASEGALANLLTALANLGLITNSTTAS